MRQAGIPVGLISITADGSSNGCQREDNLLQLDQGAVNRALGKVHAGHVVAADLVGEAGLFIATTLVLVDSLCVEARTFC